MRFRFEQEYGQGKHIAYLLSGLLFAEAMLLLGSVFYSGRAAEQLVVENVLLCIQLVLAFSTMLLMLHQSNHASSGLTGSQPETQNRFKEVAGSEDRVALFETVFQLVPDTVTITRLDTGQYLDVNRNWEPMSGYSREEAIGRTSTELNLWVNPEQRREFVARVAHEAEVRNVQAAFRHKDGRIFQCRISGTRFSLNGCEYLMLTSRNIDMEIATENARLTAETMLRENEKNIPRCFSCRPCLWD
jgi:PAS domain S-box-containing protein